MVITFFHLELEKGLTEVQIQCVTKQLFEVNNYFTNSNNNDNVF